MHPILFDFGFFFIPSWHFFYMVGAISVLLLYGKLGPAWYPKIERDTWYVSWMIGYSGGYLGARAGSAIFEQQLQISWSGFYEYLMPGPMMLYGGVIGSIVSVLIFTAFRRISPLKLADVAAPCGMLGLAIGRVGCFLNGDDYGIRVLSDPAPFWSVTFPFHPRPEPRVPVQLIESFFCLSIFASSVCLRKRNLISVQGMGCLYAFGCYSIGRFFIEFWRGDDRGPLFYNLFSPSQMISMFILGLCFMLLPVVKKKFPV